MGCLPHRKKRVPKNHSSNKNVSSNYQTTEHQKDYPLLPIKAINKRKQIAGDSIVTPRSCVGSDATVLRTTNSDGLLLKVTPRESSCSNQEAAVSATIEPNANLFFNATSVSRSFNSADREPPFSLIASVADHAFDETLKRQFVSYFRDGATMRLDDDDENEDQDDCSSIQSDMGSKQLKCSELVVPHTSEIGWTWTDETDINLARISHLDPRLVLNRCVSQTALSKTGGTDNVPNTTAKLNPQEATGAHQSSKLTDASSLESEASMPLGSTTDSSGFESPPDQHNEELALVSPVTTTQSALLSIRSTIVSKLHEISQFARQTTNDGWLLPSIFHSCSGSKQPRESSVYE